MTNEVESLHPYRVHTLSGHVHLVSVPFADIKDFWSWVAELAKDEDRVAGHVINSKTGMVFETLIKASAIIAIDSACDRTPMVISELKQTLVVERTRNAVKKAKVKKKKAQEAASTTKKSAKKRVL